MQCVNELVCLQDGNEKNEKSGSILFECIDVFFFTYNTGVCGGANGNSRANGNAYSNGGTNGNSRADGNAYSNGGTNGNSSANRNVYACGNSGTNGNGSAYSDGGTNRNAHGERDSSTHNGNWKVVAISRTKSAANHRWGRGRRLYL